ncbi:unnamed protein product [Amoebophrya sp. A120]|nr:unnamed protein product [Amoebophrya sp. A120]|eukprot:GSA120T00011832001.1
MTSDEKVLHAALRWEAERKPTPLDWKTHIREERDAYREMADLLTSDLSRIDDKIASVKAENENCRSPEAMDEKIRGLTNLVKSCGRITRDIPELADLMEPEFEVVNMHQELEDLAAESEEFFGALERDGGGGIGNDSTAPATTSPLLAQTGACPPIVPPQAVWEKLRARQFFRYLGRLAEPDPETMELEDRLTNLRFQAGQALPDDALIRNWEIAEKAKLQAELQACRDDPNFIAMAEDDSAEEPGSAFV